MSRSSLRAVGGITLSLLVGGGLFAACGGGGEELSIMRSFFQASRYGDRTTLGNMSMVVFDPQEEGIASSPSVEAVTEEQRRPLRMIELSEELQTLRADETAFREEKKAYQDENFDVIARVVEAERAGEDVRRRDQEVQEAWAKWVEDEREFARQVSAKQNELNDESRIAQVSTYDPANPLNVVEFEGELISKEVTVSASIERDGSSEDRTMTVTLQMVELAGGETGMIEGRWIITAIE
ncbi:MAG: hypothetical protein OXH69_24595 [Acidobacteria bacterium]|nr:hypothetical protein [Acidobacteriota bacterium]